MSRQIVFGILLFFLTNVYSQRKSGEVNYKLFAIKFELDSKDTSINDITKKIWKEAENQSFKLSFNNLKSSFIQHQVLTKENEIGKTNILDKIASNLVSTPYSYFIDFSEKSYILKTVDGILIEKPREIYNWKITTETKNIGSYLCYKATCFKSFIGRDGKEKSIQITAWFAPSLPYSFGPKDYNGLPGLILELTENKSIYYASNISIFNDIEIKIQFPSGKTISEFEYAKKILTE
jgi:GLPGLI family protein